MKIWQTHIGEWERSGLSQRRYCDERRIPLSTFRWWRNRLKEAPVNEAATGVVRVPIKVGALVAPGELVVELGRFRVTVRGILDREQLDGVLDVLESR